MKTVFLLGAGFSIPADFPSGQKLNERFFNDVENKILRHSSGEWQWDEHGAIVGHNGRLNSDYLRNSYLLSELVEQFQKENHSVFDYEIFYDWFLSKWNNIEFMQECCEIVNDRLKGKVIEKSSHFFGKVTINQYIDFDKCYNHLIADLLDRSYKRDERLHLYEKFAYLIQRNETDIFTLNHDLLIDYILKKYDIPFSDGFTEVDSCIVGYENNPLPIFTNEYEEKIRLFKLHGSIDYFLFREANQTYNQYDLTGNYYFFKTRNYHDKHDAKRIDLATGKVVQDFNFEITPQFLTGKSKLEVINDHLIYAPMFENLKKSLSTAEKVIVIGYSYGDPHINTVLKQAIDGFKFELVNVNPYVEFPFRKDYKRDFVKELKSITDLNIT